MKYQISNNKKPPQLNSIILIPTNKSINLIGIVEYIKNDDIYVLLMDRNGRMKITTNDNWIKLSIKELNEFRNSYKMYCNQNTDNLMSVGYSNFKAKYQFE